MMNPYEIALIAAGCAVALGLTVLAYLCISGRLVFVRNPLHRADSTLLGLDSADSYVPALLLFAVFLNLCYIYVDVGCVADPLIAPVSMS